MQTPSVRKLSTTIIILVLVSLFATTTLASAGKTPPPYLVRKQPYVVIKSLLTVGDSVNNKPDGTPYRMVGFPDGLGAFDNGDGTFTLLMNHELGDTVGIQRAHGATGAFVSKWIINKGNLRVLHGEDLIQSIVTWNPNGYWNDPAKGVALSRLCSADLPPLSAFYDQASGLGYNGRIFMNGEEKGAEGRAFAHLLNGVSYELPWLGKFSWENSVAHPDPGLKTVVVGLDDSGGGQVYVYVGEKTSSSDPIEAAGLSNGVLYGIKVEGFPVEDNTSGIPSGTPFTVHNFGDVSYLSGAELEALSNANSVTAFQRPEDGAWDPNNPADFYFVTTASFTANSRLWRLRFNDPTNPMAGGKIDMLLDGSEGPKMMDNLTVDTRGRVFIQEDPGRQDYLAKIWRYSIANDSLELIAEHDPLRFIPGAPNFLTRDEESSGIIPLDDIFGSGWFILVSQAHYATDAELVEGGQLLVLRYPPNR